MCKIFAMTNMERVALTPKFIGVVRDNVCRLSDKDGFGYASLGDDGTLGGERTMRPFSFTPMCIPSDQTITGKLPITLKTRDYFGAVNLKKPKSFIAHGRLSTNTVAVKNTHPFTNGEVALIHNGIVHDESGLAGPLKTDCDTEVLLKYWEQGGMSEVEDNVSGYYALAVLDKKGKLHIARDDTAMLYISWVRTVNSFMIATTTEIIAGVCKKMKWKYDQPEELNENMYAVFDRNEIEVNRKIEPIGRWSSFMSPKERAALGYDGDYASGYGGYRGGSYSGPHTGTSTTTQSTTKSFSESDPELEPVPGYKELADKEDFYEGRAGSKSEGESHVTQEDEQGLLESEEARMIALARAQGLEPEEYESVLPRNVPMDGIPGEDDEGDGRMTEGFYSEDDEADRIQDAVEAMESYTHLRRHP